MPASLRKPLALAALFLSGLVGYTLLAHGTTELSWIQFALATAIAGALAAIWDLTVQRPVRRGLGQLEDRMRHLSVRKHPGPNPTGATRNDTLLRLDQTLVARQHRIAEYTDKLRQELQRFKAIYRQSHDAVLIFDPVDRQLLDCNPRTSEFLRMTPDQLTGISLVELHDEDSSFLSKLVDEVMTHGHGRSLRINYRTGDGGIIPAEVSASRIELDTGDLLLCIARDVSEREHAAERIQHMAYHDALTSLPNRTLLTDRVNRAAARARRTGQIGALLFLDLDKFKRINDSLGHSIGDELLKELAQRLRRTLREEDTVARLGGDEFVVLLEGLGSDQDHAVDKAREIAEKVRSVFVDEYRLDGHELYVTASIGIVTFPNDGDTVDTLLRHADTAMYHAKGAGRDGARVFEPSMDEAAISRLRLENELRNGLRDEQFELYFQPVLAIRDGHVLGAEALLRWHHPDKGIIAPADFLPYIENCALMLKLDAWVLSESCRLLGSIQSDPNLQPPECLAINISHQQFHQQDFVDRVQQILLETGADPHRLQLEITETVLIKEAKDSVQRMEELRQLGIRFAIDDFGTGYSSLADLRQLPIDTLKIDRSFIRDIAVDPNDAAIVRAILSMARHIGLTVIAEGVEDREQLQFLRAADCTYYQGFLGRPPLSEERFREELRFSGELYTSPMMPPPTDRPAIDSGLRALGD